MTVGRNNYIKILIVLVGILLLFQTTAPTSLASSNSPSKDLSQGGLTKLQLDDSENAKQRTAELRKEWGKLIESGNGGDKKLNKSMSSQNFSTFSSGTYSTRPGTFMITLDTASSDSSIWAGGHSAITYNDDLTVESWGNQGASLNGVRTWDNDWLTRYDHFTQRTVNDTTVSQDELAAISAYSYEGTPYNYSFYEIDQDDYFYCSQLVYYQFKHWYGIDLNDGGAVWPVDLTETDEAYTIYTQ